MRNQPQISIITPVFNAEKTLERFLTSILSQDFDDFEVIVVDDGSTDSSNIILNRYSQLDDRLRVFRQKNAGASAARNYALNLVRGEWIAFADSDDFVDASWLSNFMHHSNGRDLVVQGFNVIYDNNIHYSGISHEFTGLIELPCKVGTSKDDLRDFLADLNRKSIVGFLWCKLFKSSIIKMLDLKFNTLYKVMEDEDFIFRYLIYVNSFSNISGGQYNYICPDYSSKYSPNRQCILDLWASAKILFKSDSRLFEFATRYSNYYITALIKSYESGDLIDNAAGLKCYKEEFMSLGAKGSNLKAKLFHLFFFPNMLNLSHRIYIGLFASIKYLQSKTS